MIDINIQLSVSLFGDFEFLSATSENIREVMNVFGDNDFLPTTFTEITPTNSVPHIRIALQSPNGEWNISFATSRIDIDQNNSDIRGSNLEDEEKFISTVLSLYSKILDKYNKKGTRIAFRSNGLFKEMNASEQENWKSRNIDQIKFFESNYPLEWSNRVLSQIEYDIDNNNEKINVIRQLEKKIFIFSNDQGKHYFDRLNLSFDINTFQKNLFERFNEKSIDQFLKQASETRKEVISQYNKILFQE